ncbi:hypothetical protein BKA61DRAFT_578217 [Leptodontidium sp. MPI-SDFR-AT-0119]|nr:hypothetical protein BKA61DRAFT_578217 [Leptodontidium sp. MPI-SDFR-AT-0119]
MNASQPSSTISPPPPYASILSAILTHQKERKAADDEAARQIKDKMIVEYRNQSEQHEKLTTEFVGRLQGGLDGLVATLLNQALSGCGDNDEMNNKFHESINNYLLSHLGIYQKAVKKHKINSRQRTDRLSGKAFTRYNQTLEKDESDLLDLFNKLHDAYQATFPTSVTNSSSSEVSKSISDRRLNSVMIKQEREWEYEPEPQLNQISFSHDQHDSDVEMGGFCGSFSPPTSCGEKSTLSGRDKKRKI